MVVTKPSSEFSVANIFGKLEVRVDLTRNLDASASPFKDQGKYPDSDRFLHTSGLIENINIHSMNTNDIYLAREKEAAMARLISPERGLLYNAKRASVSADNAEIEKYKFSPGEEVLKSGFSGSGKPVKTLDLAKRGVIGLKRLSFENGTQYLTFTVSANITGFSKNTNPNSTQVIYELDSIDSQVIHQAFSVEIPKPVSPEFNNLYFALTGTDYQPPEKPPQMEKYDGDFVRQSKGYAVETLGSPGLPKIVDLTPGLIAYMVKRTNELYDVPENERKTYKESVRTSPLTAAEKTQYAEGLVAEFRKAQGLETPALEQMTGKSEPPPPPASAAKLDAAATLPPGVTYEVQPTATRVTLTFPKDNLRPAIDTLDATFPDNSDVNVEVYSDTNSITLTFPDGKPEHVKTLRDLAPKLTAATPELYFGKVLSVLDSNSPSPDALAAPATNLRTSFKVGGADGISFEEVAQPTPTPASEKLNILLRGNLVREIQFNDPRGGQKSLAFHVPRRIHQTQYGESVDPVILALNEAAEGSTKRQNRMITITLPNDPKQAAALLDILGPEAGLPTAAQEFHAAVDKVANPPTVVIEDEGLDSQLAEPKSPAQQLNSILKTLTSPLPAFDAATGTLTFTAPKNQPLAEVIGAMNTAAPGSAIYKDSTATVTLPKDADAAKNLAALFGDTNTLHHDVRTFVETANKPPERPLTVSNLSPNVVEYDRAGNVIDGAPPKAADAATKVAAGVKKNSPQPAPKKPTLEDTKAVALSVLKKSEFELTTAGNTSVIKVTTAKQSNADSIMLTRATLLNAADKDRNIAVVVRGTEGLDISITHPCDNYKLMDVHQVLKDAVNQDPAKFDQVCTIIIAVGNAQYDAERAAEPAPPPKAADAPPARTKDDTSVGSHNPTVIVNAPTEADVPDKLPQPPAAKPATAQELLRGSKFNYRDNGEVKLSEVVVTLPEGSSPEALDTVRKLIKAPSGKYKNISLFNSFPEQPAALTIAINHPCDEAELKHLTDTIRKEVAGDGTSPPGVDMFQTLAAMADVRAGRKGPPESIAHQILGTLAEVDAVIAKINHKQTQAKEAARVEEVLFESPAPPQPKPAGKPDDRFTGTPNVTVNFGATDDTVGLKPVGGNPPLRVTSSESVAQQDNPKVSFVLVNLPNMDTVKKAALILKLRDQANREGLEKSSLSLNGETGEVKIAFAHPCPKDIIAFKNMLTKAAKGDPAKIAEVEAKFTTVIEKDIITGSQEADFRRGLGETLTEVEATGLNDGKKNRETTPKTSIFKVKLDKHTKGVKAGQPWTTPEVRRIAEKLNEDSKGLNYKAVASVDPSGKLQIEFTHPCATAEIHAFHNMFKKIAETKNTGKTHLVDLEFSRIIARDDRSRGGVA